VITRERALEILDTIADPCATNAGVLIGIVSMGLVHDLTITDGGSADSAASGATVRLAVAVTEPTCVMYHHFAVEADRRLRAEHGVADVEVRVLPYRMWTEDDMSADAQARLRAARDARRTTLPHPVRRVTANPDADAISR
jgi:metal-sulfur cluster biosynthetic enzyme